MRSVGRIPGLALDDIRCNRGQVFREGEALLDALDGFLARIAVCLGRKLHEPLIELIKRGAGVSLPQMWLIGINGHELI
jgi:hypothetical protein